MLILFDIIFSLYENTLFLYLLKKQVKEYKIMNVFPDVIVIILTTFTLLMIQYLKLPIPDVVPFIIILTYVKVTSKTGLLKCIMWTILDVILFMGTLTLISGVFDLQVGINGVISLESESAILTYMLISNSALTVVVSIAMRFSKEKNLLSIGETILFILMLLLCFVVNECFFYTRFVINNNNILLIGSICAFALTMFIMVLYELLVENIRRTHNYELSAKTSAIVAEHQEELKSIYTSMLSEQHDLKHRITAIEEILSAGALDKSKKEEVLTLLPKSESQKIYITGNIAVDAIIRAKSIVMEQNSIDFIFIEYPIHSLPVSDNDFCMLIGNLLDNAIEAVMHLDYASPDRQIKLKFHKAWDMFFVTCENGVNPSLIRRNGDEFISTKANPRLHGFGTKNNKLIVEKSGGTIDYEITENKFIVNIMWGSSQ